MATNSKQNKIRPKCRLYLVECIKFRLVPFPSNTLLPMCLLCKKTLTTEAMKLSRLQDHLRRIHPDKANKSMEFFQALKKSEARSSIRNVFAQNTCRNVKGLIASYKVSSLIAKEDLTFTAGERLVVPAVKEIISTVMERDPAPIVQALPLMLGKTSFSVQLNETTTSDYNALLMTYVRYIAHGKITEELSLCKYLETDTKGQAIYQTLIAYLQDKSIPLVNMLVCAVDGVPSMVSMYRGLLSLLRQKIPHLFTIHCVTHRQHLVTKRLSLPLQESLNVAVIAINKVKTSFGSYAKKMMKNVIASSLKLHVTNLVI
ncbi:SCAN domain-containing protein 3-like [Clavelina lepadiformis]|uniref:SCAN domain-containing protein 3-like n=1 Tax=Clavelina lepadiformis TaxID=159417 RepID=UPI00404255C9